MAKSKSKHPIKVEMSIEDKKVKGAKCPTFRVSFPHVFEKKAFKEGQEAKYRISMLFDKNTDLTELKRAAHNATVEVFGKNKTEWPKLTKPFTDGDTMEDRPEYTGKIVVNATSKGKPGVIDRSGELITNPEDFYGGCFAKASLVAFYYKEGKNEGISFVFQNVMKMKDGESFSGKPEASSDFEGVEDDDSTERETYEDGDDDDYEI